MKVDENGFHYAQAGFVFHDPLGEFTRRQTAFKDAYYTEEVWHWRLAVRLLELWHYGDYNLARMACRGESVGALVGQGRAVQAAMRITFLLNKRFAPYWKWLRPAFLELPYLS